MPDVVQLEDQVAPYAGAWIETGSSRALSGLLSGRALRGRVD